MKLTDKQKKSIEKLLSDTVTTLRFNCSKSTCYSNKENAAKAVKEILEFILSFKSYQDVDNLIEKYPEAQDNIKILSALRFEETVSSRLDATNFPTWDLSLKQTIITISFDFLKRHLGMQSQFIKIAKQQDIVLAKTRKDEQSNKDIPANSKSSNAVRLQKETDSTFNNTDVLNQNMGLFTTPDQRRQEWINNSPFALELKKVQATIERLDSAIVYKGKAKANSIKIAFNKAIDAGLTGKVFNNFNDFKMYKPLLNEGFFQSGNNYLSLDNALSIHRFETIDKLLHITKPKSHM